MGSLFLPGTTCPTFTPILKKKLQKSRAMVTNLKLAVVDPGGDGGPGPALPPVKTSQKKMPAAHSRVIGSPRTNFWIYY